MAIYKSDIVNIDLDSGSIFRSFLNNTIGTADKDANRFGVRVFRSGAEVDLSGCSCYGYFRDPQGNNIALTSVGTVSGNEAYITLPQACYNYEGQFCLAIKLIGGGVTGTVRIIDGVVDNTNTGSAVAPTSAVPTYTEILSQYDAMVAATAAANTAIAPTFAQGTAYAAGALVINDGALYALPNGHTAGTTWANTTKVATNLGDQVTSLKSAFVNSSSVNKTLNLSFEQGNINASTGQQKTANNRIRTRYYYYVPLGFSFTVPEGFKAFLYYYDQESSEGYKGNNGSWLTGNISEALPRGQYIRIVIANTSDTNLTPSDVTSPISMICVINTDESLTKQYRAADGKATGEAITSVRTDMGKIKGVIEEDHTDELDFVQGNIKSSTGGNEQSTTRIRTNDYYDCAFGFDIEIPTGFKAFFYYYTEAAYTTKSGNSETWQTGEVSVEYQNGRYVRFVIAKSDDSAITPSDITNPITLTRHTIFGQQEVVSRVFERDSWGLANVLANSQHIAGVKWTPVGNMPKTVNNDSPTPQTVQYFSIAQQTGIPYSSVRDQDKAVGMDVSIHTFMTAVKDPNSVLYKRLSTVSNSSTYYGTVCSGMINYADGINLDLTNYYLSESDMFETIPMQSIQKGDMIWVDGHCALVYDTEKDQYGRINKVVIREEWKPLPRTVTYKSWASFMSARSGYIARRFKNTAGVNYTPIPYVQCFDEVPEEITYPDVQTDHGDAAVFMKGEDVTINIINARDFTTITVEKGGATVQTVTTIAAFTLSNVQPGLYTITANGGTYESVSTFFVVEAEGTFDLSTGIVTFSATNATPVLVNVYKLPSNRKVECKPIILSDEDRVAGQINVSEYIDSNFKYAKVTFLTPYGTAVWYSETHDKWVAIGS